VRTGTRSRAVVIVWVGSVLLASTIGFALGWRSHPTCQERQLSGRTYYESLDLSTPEGAVQEFCAAFRRRDYATVYLVLAPQSHFLMFQDMLMLRQGRLVKKEFAAEINLESCVASEGIGSCDYWDERDLLFDDLMLRAEERSAFLIDLRAKETITGRRSATTHSGEPAIDVTTTVEGIHGEVVFRTVQIPVSRRWRVLQVIVPGGNEELIPWSVPTAQ
jgi:hypothetical protein